MSLFWGETYGFLSQLKNNISSGEIFLIQCDDEIQKEEHFLVENISEDVPELVKVRGFGGTSFIPVFERIEELRGEGKKINSLIYLTDGMGLYPQKKPDYPVYFVLPDNGFDRQGRLPGWIERVYLRDR
jgi:predicted metal-dependent peptidase